MKTKKVLFALVLVSTITLLTSCKTLDNIFGKNARAETEAKNKVEEIQKKETKNDKAKIDQISILASGTDYALNKVTNKEVPVFVAQDLNKRVISLSGKPDLDVEKEMWKTVDDLTSELANQRAKGEKALERKDLQIAALQKETKTLESARDVEIKKYMDLTAQIARKADTALAKLESMDKWFGLGAVWYGIKKFITDSFWTVTVIGILFLVIRILSPLSPIAAAVMNVFEHMVSWVINGITVLFPKAVSLAGNVSKQVYDSASMLLKKIVDSIQTIKEIEKKTGKDITLKELLVEFDKTLDKSEKDIIDKIKKELGY